MTALIAILLLLGGERTVVTTDEFRGAIDRYLRAHPAADGVERETEYKSLPKDLTLPKGEYELRVSLSQPLAAKGHCGIPVELLRNGAVERTILCSVLLRTYENVYVLIRPFEKNEMIDPSFLIVRRVETTTMDDAIPATADLSGLRTKRMVKENSVLQRSIIEQLPVVHRDQRVSLLVRTSSITIGASGIAKEDGRVGDEIVVQRSGSKETVRGTVVGPSVVHIDVK